MKQVEAVRPRSIQALSSCTRVSFRIPCVEFGVFSL
jgi:hypothetical protein